MGSSAKHYLQQAGNIFHGSIQNGERGVLIAGNVNNHGGTMNIQTYMKSAEERLRECRTALHLGWTDPFEDRAKIISVKTKRGRIITAHCDWILSHPMYKAWENTRTRSQLLWITSMEERRQDHDGDSSQQRIGKACWDQHLFEVYDLQKNQLFNPNGIEALWSIFMKMASDPIAGQVYCIIDGLDYCSDDSLRRLIGLITNFFLDEPQTIIDENTNAELYRQEPFSSYAPQYSQTSPYPQGAPPGYPQASQTSPYPQASQTSPYTQGSQANPNLQSSHPQNPYSQGTPSAPGNAQRRSGPKRGAGLKMILVSREKPEWMVDQLSEFSCIDIGVRGKRYGSATGSAAPKSARRVPTLADVAATIMQKQTQDKGNNNTSMVSDTLPTHTKISASNPTSSVGLGSSSHALIPSPYGTSSTQTPAVQKPISLMNANLSPGQKNTSTMRFSNTETQNLTVSSPPPTSQNSTKPNSSTGFVSPIHTPVSISRPLLPTTQPDQEGTAPTQPQVFELDSSRPTKHSSVYVPPFVESVLDESQHTEEPLEYAQGEFTTAYGEDKKDRCESASVDTDFDDPALRLYIEAKLEELAIERQYPTEVQSYIIAALEHRGDDTFLWVDFAIEEIRKVELAQIETVLNSIPPTLTEMYIYILLNIQPALVEFVAGLLRWIVCAKRPLDVQELAFALNLSHYHANDATNYVLNAVYACGNMLKVSSEDETVNIVHSSLVDFLSGASSPILADPRLSKFVICPTHVDSDIANFCISYLEAGCCNEGSICLAENAVQYNQRVAQFPFMPYAASFWSEHLRNAANPYLNLSSPFFQSKSIIRKNWWHTYWAFSTGKGTWVAPMNFTLLHLAAYLDLVPLAQQMMQKGDLQSRLDKRDSHGVSPIDYTVARGHLTMFQFLIRVGASQKGNGESLLELACRKGQRDIVSALIDMGYNINMRAKGMTAKESMYFMTKWLPGIVSEGLEYDRDAWSLMFRDVGIDELTPLGQAAIFGHRAVIELLIDRGAIVDAGTTKGFTPLHTASYTGQMECVQLFIHRGATITIQTADRWLPLHFAALRGKLAIVEFFLDRGVPIESMTVKLKSALHLAAYSGHADVVRVLLERGANLELKSHKGETPLHLATRNLKPQIIELLLSFGANRAAITNDGKAALDLVQTSTSILGKECKRILQTFGFQGYIPWTPPQDSHITTTPGTSTEGGTAREFAGSASTEERRDSVGPVPIQRFTPAQAPKSCPIQGFQANISLYRGYPPTQSAPQNMYTAAHPAMQQSMNTAYPSTSNPNFEQAQLKPTQEQSKFTYDAQATLQQQFMEPQNAMLFGSMSPSSGSPPPYTPHAAGSNMYSPSNVHQKSPSTTISANVSNINLCQTPSVTPTPNAQLAHPAQPQQPTGQLSMIQMMNAFSISNTAPTSTEPPVSPNYALRQSSSKPHFTQSQSYPSTASTIQTPVSFSIIPTQPATAPPVSPHQPTPIPTPTLAPIPSTQPYQTSPQIMPVQYTRSLSLNTNPYTPSPTPQFLTPTPTTPYPYQLQQLQPVQSSQFTGETTASTYNASLEYSAPAVVTPYNPNIGQSPGQMGVPAIGQGAWQGQGHQLNDQGVNGMGNGMLFSPPPTTPVLQKKKSFLGGLRGG